MSSSIQFSYVGIPTSKQDRPYQFFRIFVSIFFHCNLYFSVGSSGPRNVFTDSDRVKKGLSNDYKIVENKVATSLHLGHTMHRAATVIVRFFIIHVYLTYE